MKKRQNGKLFGIKIVWNVGFEGAVEKIHELNFTQSFFQAQADP